MIRIVARDSRLSLLQVKEVIASLASFEYTFTPVKSVGDKDHGISLLENTPSDIFTRELDQAVLDGQADIAIHSAKDLPYPLRRGLRVIALTSTLDPRDALVSRDNVVLMVLPKDARVGTSSKVRRDQLAAVRSDLEVVSVRGTIDERLALVDSGKLDALIVAACALERLGLSGRVAEFLPFETHPLQGRLVAVARADREDLAELFWPIDARKNFGKVVIAGFGPGDPGLLTLRAYGALQAAGVIFHDDLIDIDFLKIFSGEKVYVGKRKDAHSHLQEEINRKLYAAAKSGKSVVRLKGGDPFVFGRGGEEFDFLRERLIDVEVVPGITAAIGAGASAGIPLTHRDLSSSVAFATGHPLEKMQVPDADTLVYYMASTKIAEMAQKILKGGRPAETPVALIQNATREDQRVYFHTLGELAGGVIAYDSPLIAIIGKVAIDRNYFLEPSLRPKVLVTGTDASLYAHLGEVVHTPLIELLPVDDPASLRPCLEASCDVVVFTSRYAVRFFMEFLLKEGKDARWFGGKMIVSIGRVTSAELKVFGLVPDLQATDESSTGIVTLFREQKITDRRILVPRSVLALGIIPKELTALGNQVECVMVYQNVMPSEPLRVDLSQFDIVVFTSPSTVRNFLHVYGAIPSHIEVIARGEQTEKALAALAHA